MPRIYMTAKKREQAALIVANTSRIAAERLAARETAKAEKLAAIAAMAVTLPWRTVEETSTAQVEASEYAKGLLENAIGKSWN